MSDHRCEEARELIPDLVAGRLDGPAALRVEDHLEGCSSCSREAALVAVVHRGRVAAPRVVAEEVRARLAELSPTVGERGVERVRGGASGSPGIVFPWWGLAAAAVAAVALGIGVQARGPVPVESPAGVPSFAMEGAEDDLWLSGDGEIAGAPTLEDLSDQDLLRFLEELGEGGAA